jgi:hypothetical protein
LWHIRAKFAGQRAIYQVGSFGSSQLAFGSSHSAVLHHLALDRRFVVACVPEVVQREVV